MHYVVRSPFRLAVLLLGLVFALAACSTESPPTTNAATADKEIAFIANVPISASQSKAEVEAMYGGKASIFAPEAGFAVLGFSKEDSELTTLSNLEPNSELNLDTLVDTGETGIAKGNSAWASGTSAWATGNSAWATGNSAWASGSSAWATGTSAWASGTALPSQSYASLNLINIKQAHAVSTKFGLGVKVAVLDTGLDLSHPAFSGRLAPAGEWRDLIDNDSNPQDVSGGAMYGHGTAVAGLITQVSPMSSILPIRVLDTHGNGRLINVAIGVYYAVRSGAKVINISIGSDSHSAVLAMLIDYAARSGVQVVMSSGNEGNAQVDYPAVYANSGTQEAKLISVGSVNASGQRSSFSNYGSDLEFLAPGEGMFSSFPDNKVGYFTGTSFASPVVAGLVALGISDSGSTPAFESYLAIGAQAVTGSGNGYGIPKANTFLANLP